MIYSIIARGGFPPPALFEKPVDQVNQHSDKIEDCGNQDNRLKGAVLVALFLSPGFLCHQYHPLSVYNYKPFGLICQPFILTFS